MSKTDHWIGLFFAIFSTYICVESLRLGLGTFHRPGPGFMAFYCGIVLGVLSIILVSLKFLRNPEEGPSWGKWGKVIILVVAIFVFTLFLEKIGFLLSTFLFIFFVLKVVERRRWRFSVGVALLVAMASYVVFDILLEAQLPAGVLGR
jgi:putative tricarboxylic transport membrane protein